MAKPPTQAIDSKPATPVIVMDQNFTMLGSFLSSTATAAGTLVVASGSGVFHSINFLGGATSSVAIFDGPSSSANMILPGILASNATFPLSQTLTFDVQYNTGIVVVTSGNLIYQVSFR